MRWIQTSLGLAIVAVVAIAGGARADWNPGQPAKWVQLPDLSPTGMDVYDTRWPATEPTSAIFKILGDDWLCTSVDPVTDIHIWGSWLNNHVPTTPVKFKLSIHEDVPAGVDAPWSHPGAEVWSAILAGTKRLYAPSTQFPGPITEQFYDPNTNQIIGADNEVYQYNFTNLPNPFVQQGTPSQPKIYWLDVQATTPDSQAIFGWKTSLQHNLDDAVWADTQTHGGPLLPNPNNPGGLPWTDLRYPSGHPFGGQSIDLAFVITTVPEPATLTGLVMGALALLAWRRRAA